MLLIDHGNGINPARLTVFQPGGSGPTFNGLFYRFAPVPALCTNTAVYSCPSWPFNGRLPYIIDPPFGGVNMQTPFFTVDLHFAAFLPAALHLEF
ncbi:MAG TPA: hypothetical protein ENN91_01540 [Firmicutes bacterium]|nr:hypothetical protein [Bacillota bacterium]